MGGREGWGGVWPKKVARSLPVKNLVALKKSHRSDFMSWGGRKQAKRLISLLQPSNSEKA